VERLRRFHSFQPVEEELVDDQEIDFR
jgi:hypothetical protein